MPVILAKQEASMLTEVMGSIMGWYILIIVVWGEWGPGVVFWGSLVQ
jgi:hypothetical protein